MEQLHLKGLFLIMKKRLLLIILITLFTTLISAVVSYFVIKPAYKATISVIIGKQATDSISNTQLNDLTMYQKSVKTYAVLATSRTVAEDTIKKLNLDIDANSLISMVSATPNSDTEFITLTVKSQDPELAFNVANQLAKSLKDVSKTIKNEDLVNLVDGAVFPTSPDSPVPLLNIVVAFALGLIFSIVLVFLLEYFDNTIKSVEDVENILGLSVIGNIPIMDVK
ncbi:MAG: YveK family protein [Clostridiaceae bacterium]